MIERILMVLLSLAPSVTDAGESTAGRTARLREVAEGIVNATDDVDEMAALVADAYEESRLARYVTDDRCADGPVGARCDLGRARGVFQVHDWCVGAWTLPSGRAQGVTAGAVCALSLMRAAPASCPGVDRRVAAQSRLGGDACSTASGRAKAALQRNVRDQLN